MSNSFLCFISNIEEFRKEEIGFLLVYTLFLIYLDMYIILFALMFNHSEKIDVKDFSRRDAEEYCAKKRKNTHSKFERFREINKLPYRLTVNIVTVYM